MKFFNKKVTSLLFQWKVQEFPFIWLVAVLSPAIQGAYTPVAAIWLINIK